MVSTLGVGSRGEVRDSGRGRRAKPFSMCIVLRLIEGRAWSFAGVGADGSIPCGIRRRWR